MSSGNVVGIRGAEIPPDEIDSAARRVVETLEVALGEARKGKYFAVGWVLVARNGDVDCDCLRNWTSSPEAAPSRLASGLRFLEHDIAGCASKDSV